MRGLLGLVAAVICAAACSTGSSTFALTGASVDPTYFCPGGANNAAYDMHATIDVHNGTGKAVTIDSITAQMTLASVTGDWLEKVGDRYDAGSAKFNPSDVAAGADAKVKVTIPSACTSGTYGTGVSSSGNYRVIMRVVTSAGTFSVTSANEHEIVAA
ncbi:MAG TPA: hypothetical protein VLK30_07105 [Candidatus Limnocylindrales bacterium]|nr:hypothetical protein [Candidatus Limnocylindrales bacterium]